MPTTSHSSSIPFVAIFVTYILLHGALIVFIKTQEEDVKWSEGKEKKIRMQVINVMKKISHWFPAIYLVLVGLLVLSS